MLNRRIKLVEGLASLSSVLVASTDEHFVSYGDFLDAAPPVFMAPDVSPVQEVGHWNHRAGKSTNEGLATNHREAEEDKGREDHAILESTHLVLLTPILLFFEIAFRGR